MARGFAVAALPIAIGAALEVSDITGATLSAVAWVLVALTTTFLMIQWLWMQRKALRAGWASRWHQLGNELIAFRHGRRADSPTMTIGGGPLRWGRSLRRSRRRAERRKLHDADTMLLYLELFAKRVRRALRELRKVGLVGEIEAETLANPDTPEAIERLGRRLIDLSYKMPQAD